MNKPKILLIGKGGAKEGMGHLVRISVLADAFLPGYDVTVLVKQDRFGDFFFKQKKIDCFTYRDNRGLLRFLEKTGKYEIIVIDIYRISIGVIEKIADYCDFLLNFDDMQRRVHQPLNIKGVFICPQEPFNREIENRGTVTTAKGTDYFPLAQKYTRYRQKKRFRKDVTNIGIILGGVPSKTHTLGLTRLLDNFLDKKINLHVVMGFEPGEIDPDPFSSRVYVEKNIDDMAAFIAGMDLGIIAGGFLKFEFMCIGTPFALVSLCDHQQKLARKFASKGYGVYFGDIKHLIGNQKNEARLKRKMAALVLNEKLREEMFRNSRQLVDGQGSYRILDMVNSSIEKVL